jgi:hypothetical protein
VRAFLTQARDAGASFEQNVAGLLGLATLLEKTAAGLSARASKSSA